MNSISSKYFYKVYRIANSSTCSFRAIDLAKAILTEYSVSPITLFLVSSFELRVLIDLMNFERVRSHRKSVPRHFRVRRLVQFTHLKHCRSACRNAAAFSLWWSRAGRNHAPVWRAGSTWDRRPRRGTGKTGTRCRTLTGSSRSSAASCASNFLHHSTHTYTHGSSTRKRVPHPRQIYIIYIYIYVCVCVCVYVFPLLFSFRQCHRLPSPCSWNLRTHERKLFEKILF